MYTAGPNCEFSLVNLRVLSGTSPRVLDPKTSHNYDAYAYYYVDSQYGDENTYNITFVGTDHVESQTLFRYAGVPIFGLTNENGKYQLLNNSVNVYGVTIYDTWVGGRIYFGVENKDQINSLDYNITVSFIIGNNSISTAAGTTTSESSTGAATTGESTTAGTTTMAATTGTTTGSEVTSTTSESSTTTSGGSSTSGSNTGNTPGSTSGSTGTQQNNSSDASVIAPCILVVVAVLSLIL